MARTQIATDDFNRADGNIGSNWTYIFDIAWTGAGSTISVLSNKARALSEGSHSQIEVWAGAGSFTTDQYSKATVSGLAQNGDPYRAGVVARCSTDTDANRDYYAYWIKDTGASSKTTELFKVVNGTTTVLDTRSTTWANGDTVEIECEGTTIRGLKNGVEVVSVTDSELSAGKPGIAIGGTSSGPFLDDWEGGILSASGGSAGAAAAYLSQL